MSLLLALAFIVVFIAGCMVGVKFHALFVKEAEATLAEARSLKAEAQSLFGRSAQTKDSSANSPTPGVIVAGVPKPKV